MTRHDLEDQLVELLQKQKIGATKNHLANIIGASEPTVLKYLRILQERGEIQRITVGGNKLWSAKKTAKDPFKFLVRYFLEICLDSVCENVNLEIDWKNIGKIMSKKVKFEEILEIESMYDILLTNKITPDKFIKLFRSRSITSIAESRDDLVNRLKDFFFELFKILLDILLEGDLEPPILIKDPPILVFRLKQFEQDYNGKLILVMSGFIEDKIKQIFNGLEINKFHDI
jgi:DNA-binding Lrp family transcriptional regulator